MEYPVIVERKNGIWRAFIPALAGLSGEGRSRDEALENAQRATENYLASVELTTISVHVDAGLKLVQNGGHVLVHSGGASRT